MKGLGIIAIFIAVFALLVGALGASDVEVRQIILNATYNLGIWTNNSNEVYVNPIYPQNVNVSSNLTVNGGLSVGYPSSELLVSSENVSVYGELYVNSVKPCLSNGTNCQPTSFNDTPYLVRNGSRTLTADWVVGDFNISTNKDITFLGGHGLLWDFGKHGLTCNGVANECNLFATDEVQIDTSNLDINIDTELTTSTTSVEIRTPTHIFAPSAHPEVTTIANRMTFNNGASDTYMDWGTNGITDMGGDWYFLSDIKVTGNILSNSTKLNDVCSWNTPTSNNQALVWNLTGNCIAYKPAAAVAANNFWHSSTENLTSKTYETGVNSHNLTLVQSANSARYTVQGYIGVAGGESPCWWNIIIKKTGGSTLVTSGVSELGTNSGFNTYKNPFYIEWKDNSPSTNDYYYTQVTEQSGSCSLTILSAELDYEAG